MEVDFKKEAAVYAAGFIQDHTIVGLGGGSTISSLVGCLSEKRQKGLQIQVLASSFPTRELLEKSGFTVLNPASVTSMDIYLDGCDQFDQNLNALKSGGGIHSMEKLLAAMAKEFILVGDESKFTSTFSTKFPLAIEVFPEAMSYVESRLLKMYQLGRVSRRKKGDSEDFFWTTHGNGLLDLWFEKWPALSEINPVLKSIPGVLETSLFYGMAHKAIVAGTDGVRMLIRP